MWSSLLETWTPNLTPDTPQELILVKWPSYQEYAVVEIVQYYYCYHWCGLIPKHFHYLTKKKKKKLTFCWGLWTCHCLSNEQEDPPSYTSISFQGDYSILEKSGLKVDALHFLVCQSYGTSWSSLALQGRKQNLELGGGFVVDCV